MCKLHVDSVIKSFGSRQILTDIYLSCQKGEIIGLLGRNGTGKSTLLKIIFGSLSADRKFVRIGDTICKGLFDNRKRISYLPQDSFLPSHVKVGTMIGLFCNKRNAALLKAHKLIAPLLGKRSNQLSGGEKRLLEIMLINYSDAIYTLIDEPFNGVAPLYKEVIKKQIQENSQNKGFIITDHDYRNILDIATRVILIYDGGTKEITSRQQLVDWGYITAKS